MSRSNLQRAARALQAHQGVSYQSAHNQLTKRMHDTGEPLPLALVSLVLGPEVAATYDSDDILAMHHYLTRKDQQSP